MSLMITPTSCLLLAQNTTTASSGSSWFLLAGLILFGAALLLFIAEIFIPTGGVLGILCVISVVSSIACFFRHDAVWGVAALMLYVLLIPIALFFGLRLWTQSPLARRMVLGGVPTEAGNDEEAMYASEHARRERLGTLGALIGAEGVAATPLRPVGFVLIGGRRIDALAEGSVIEAQTPVVVVEVIDNQVKVRAHDQLPPS